MIRFPSNCVTIFFFCGLAHALPTKPLPCGTTVVLTGNVALKNRTLKLGDVIYTGDVVKTGDNSYAKFLMVDKTVMDLGANTEFLFEDYQDSPTSRSVSTSLEYGTVRAVVAKKINSKSVFSIKTKSSVLAVRGTEFVAQWELKNGKVEEKVTIAEGRLQIQPLLAGARPLEVISGQQFQTIATTEATPKALVQDLTPSQIKEVIAQAKVDDKTFSNTVTFEGGKIQKGTEKSVKPVPIAPSEGSPVSEFTEIDEQNPKTKEKVNNSTNSESVANSHKGNDTLESVFVAATGEKFSDPETKMPPTGAVEMTPSIGAKKIIDKRTVPEPNRSPASEDSHPEHSTDSTIIVPPRFGTEIPNIPATTFSPPLPPSNTTNIPTISVRVGMQP